MTTSTGKQKKATEKKTNHDLLEELVKKNTELLEENNKLLKKIHRNATLSFWLRVLWYLLLIGFPFAIYFYVLEPYFAAFGASYENFIDGLNELPGLRGIEQLIDGE